MAIVITNFKVRGVEQDSVPYMMKVILPHIPNECRVVDPNVSIKESVYNSYTANEYFINCKSESLTTT